MTNRLLPVVLLPGLLATACGGREAELPEPVVVVEVERTAILLSDLELYLRVNLLGDPVEAPSDAGEADRVKSRLLDALIDEWILLAEARRRGIEVGDAEVEAFLWKAGDEMDPGPPPSDAERMQVRRRLIIERLQEELADELPPPTDEEIRDYVARNRDRLGPSRRVILRALMVESEETARKLRQDIRKHKLSFADAAREHEIQPGQAAPMTVAWSSLSESIRRELSGLAPGEVTQPLNFQGQTYLFQLQGWLEEVEPTEEELERAARAELERRARRAANRALVAELRERGDIRIRTENLPFRYFPDAVR